MWICYLLQLVPGGATYIGATVDLGRRIRQHNGEITGGARYTTRRKKIGNEWKIVCFISGFPSERDALQFEWMWKQMSKGMKGPYLERRQKALNNLLNRGKSTYSSKEFSEYSSPLILYTPT